MLFIMLLDLWYDPKDPMFSAINTTPIGKTCIFLGFHTKGHPPPVSYTTHIFRVDSVPPRCLVKGASTTRRHLLAPSQEFPMFDWHTGLSRFTLYSLAWCQSWQPVAASNHRNHLTGGPPFARSAHGLGADLGRGRKRNLHVFTVNRGRTWKKVYHHYELY